MLLMKLKHKVERGNRHVGSVSPILYSCNIPFIYFMIYIYSAIPSIHLLIVIWCGKN